MTRRFSMGGQLEAGVLAIFCSLHFLGGLKYSLTNPHVSAATAEVTTQPVLHVFHGGVGMLVDEALGRHDESARAVSALLRVMVDEGRGNRMQIVSGGKTFDGLDALALRVDGQDAATVYGLARQDDGTGPAGAAVADPFRAGQVQIIAHGVEQRHARLDRHVDRFSVDCKRDRDWPGSSHTGWG